MTEPGELTGSTLADVIVASGAAEAPLDEDRFYEALEAHKERMPSEEELLRRQALGPRVSFRVCPNEHMGRPLLARLVEGDASAETTIGRGREITAEAPFTAQRYKNYHGKTKPGHEGGLEFAAGFTVVNTGQGVAEGLVRRNVVSVAIRNLGQVDITESRGGVIVAQWKDGQLLAPGAEEEPAADSEPASEQPAVDEPADAEPAREKIVLAPTGEPLAAKAIHFVKMSERLTDGEVDSIRRGIGIARGVCETASVKDHRVLGSFESIKRTASTGDTPVVIAGMPAQVEFSKERYITHVGTAGDPSRFSHVDERGSMLTITFNPESDETEVLTLDLEAEDIVETIAGLGRRTFINEEHVDPRHATHQWVGIVRQAAEALAGQRG